MASMGPLLNVWAAHPGGQPPPSFQQIRQSLLKMPHGRGMDDEGALQGLDMGWVGMGAADSRRQGQNDY
jgi:hypothetical protein